MTGLFKKISDYERVAGELEETRKRLSEVEESLREADSDLQRVKSQLNRSLEKVKEERRRRSDEEARRGNVEKQLREKAKELEVLKSKLAELEEAAINPEGVAVLDTESEMEAEKVLSFVNMLNFPPGESCLSIAIPPAQCGPFLTGLAGMASWVPRVAHAGRGLIAFVSGRKGCFLEPPLPVEKEEKSTGAAFDFSVLDPLLEKRLLGFVSIHRDLYAACLFDGEMKEIVFEQKEVLGKSKKGGFSQARYARFREDQVKHLLSEADEVIARFLEKANPTYVLLEGDDRMVSALTEMKGVVDKHRILRYTVTGKLTRGLLENMPRLIWRWRAWVFDLPG